jgi:hypothetical protein
MVLRLITTLSLALIGALAAPEDPSACSTAVAEAKIPSPAPEVQGVFPHGGKRGSAVQVRITGKNLKDVSAMRFSRPGIRAEIASRLESELTAKIAIDGDAEPGRHDFRLISPRGSNIAWFDVSIFDEITEAEPNDGPAQAQPITLPVLVNGVVKKGDYDFFRFSAKAGDVITFDLNGTRNGSPLDAVLALYDVSGEQLAYNDDYYIFKDPHVTYRFAKDGSYLVRVSGSEEAGSDISDYRLTIGAMPFVSHALPAGAQRGQTTTVRLQGVNLADVKDVTLGAGLVHGKVTKSSAEEVEIQLAVPADLAPGRYNLYAAGSVRPVAFVVGDLHEITELSGPPRDRPAFVELAVVINGVIGKRGEAHYFRFHVNEPGKYVLAADAMQLGGPLDPLVSLHDVTGRRIAYQDEPNTNNGLQPSNLDPHMVVDIPKAGDYVARIRDFAYRGSPDFVYRFTIKRAEPSFEVRLHVPDETLFRGRENRVKVRVRRLEGWDAPVEIRAESLPAGLTAKAVTAEPKNTTYLGGCAEKHIIDGTDVEVPIQVAPDAPASQVQLHIIATGTENGKTVTREAWTRYRWHGRAWQDAETGQLLATVADAPLLVLEPPGTLKLTGSHEGSFDLLVKRFDGGNEPLVLAASGQGANDWEIAADPIPASSTKARVKVRLRSASVPASLVLSGKAGDRMLGQSSEIRVRIEDPAGKKDVTQDH